MAQKFGKADPDLRSRVGRKGKTKEIADAKLPNPGKEVRSTGMVGGIANDRQTNRDMSKSGPKGSITRSG